MPNFRQFNDLNKPTLEILHDGYFFEKRLELKTETKGGLSFNSEGKIFDSVSSENVSPVYGSVGISHKNLPSGLNLEELKLTSDGRVVMEASVAVDPNLILAVSAADSRQETNQVQNYGIFSVLYGSKSAALTAKVDVVNGPTLFNTCLLSKGKWSFGGSVQIDTQLDQSSKRPLFIQRCCGLGYSGDDWQGTAVIKFDPMKNPTSLLTFRHDLSNDVSLAVLAGYDFKRAEPNISVGAKCMLSPDSSLKVKIDSSAIFSLSFRQKMNKIVDLTFAAQVDTKSPKFGPIKPPKFGMGISLVP
mmetsp:Transcript_17191/g.25457  ORF Transcript_17191/g.25457 Transcript_17191/m.25457 type:complete len:302 (+) Transcript_17191:21-926(+)